MLEWFDRVGYDADIVALRRDFSEVRWHSFADWARAFDWSVLERTSFLSPEVATLFSLDFWFAIVRKE